MAKSSLLLPLVLSLICIYAFTRKTWCAAKPSTSEGVLVNNIYYACEHLGSYSMIQAGGACYLPPTTVNHASVVMNLYYQSQSRELLEL
ncbi:unnamed protein product [Ilex paraguariensis]|uniref:X8 domain-containing protein n=1 Tax=Ilex paraguariensis TaxID=185542 RepID=A0ABC8UKY6_9AQUA